MHLYKIKSLCIKGTTILKQNTNLGIHSMGYVIFSVISAFCYIATFKEKELKYIWNFHISSIFF